MSHYYYGKALDVLARGTREHFVYFALAKGARSFVKIGTTYDPDKRLSTLRSGGVKEPEQISRDRSAYELSLLGWVQGDGELERLLHRAFADFRAGGEWFIYEPIAHHIDSMLATYCKCRSCSHQQFKAVSLAHI